MNYLEIFNQLCSDYSVEEDEDITKLRNFLEAQSQVSDKPLFTEAGLEILEYLQSADVSNAKAKDIADGMGTTSRKVSGSIRKLVADDFVSKVGQNPVIYNLTEKGKNFDIEAYKASLNED